MLVFAFGFLALYEALGCPGWTTEPSPYGSTGYFSVDGFVWQVVCGTFAFWGAIMLLRDEMPVRLQSEDEEAMWRYFWRRSGMPRSEFQEVLARGEWLRVKKGERIMSHVQVYEYLHLLVEGRCSCFTALRKGCEEASSTGMCSTGDQLRNYNLLSGDIFSFALCSIFGVSLGFEKISGHHLEVYADTDCLLYRWHVQQLDHMAVRSSPALSAFWRNLILYNVSNALERRTLARRAAAGTGRMFCRDSCGREESASYMEGERVQQLDHMAVRSSPALSAFWRNLILYNVSNALERRTLARRAAAGTGRMFCRDSCGREESASYMEGERSLDFSSALDKSEQPPGFWKQLGWAFWRTLNPVPHTGLRHHAQPYSGVMARNRLLAIISAGEAQTLAAQEPPFTREDTQAAIQAAASSTPPSIMRVHTYTPHQQDQGRGQEATTKGQGQGQGQGPEPGPELITATQAAKAGIQVEGEGPWGAASGHSVLKVPNAFHNHPSVV
eukprot:CAMPEP_0202919722 /NCGR_PEP_ID=MMETSP1392-20130828/76481_1 /ASSEMBLY_ACC=CAM_ASM_000868 /TAXON_ID=225041 /ORGANISM="Chlamydomonas chlamydogama, Strain SAG 11-48b" /LENGTH=498 /DNA_ID=CAMNT_0049613181 /DNA_START=199 /DNA_END=1695 /DNA_ORIENTATION=+